jgi:hypothetical protein
MSKEVIEEYNRMKKERDKLYVMMLNTQKGSGARMMRDDIYVKRRKYKKIYVATQLD